jgi:DNA-binding PadR family transcriptional regulator
MPEGVYLGELEQIVLLAVLRLGDKAYATPILEEIESQAGRTLARGALYTALDRLEQKGCLRSRLGEPLPERGGRARRYFTVTPPAVRALKDSRLALMRLWRGVESQL